MRRAGLGLSSARHNIILGQRNPGEDWLPVPFSARHGLVPFAESARFLSESQVVIYECLTCGLKTQYRETFKAAHGHGTQACVPDDQPIDYYNRPRRPGLVSPEDWSLADIAELDARRREENGLPPTGVVSSSTHRGTEANPEYSRATRAQKRRQRRTKARQLRSGRFQLPQGRTEPVEAQEPGSESSHSPPQQSERVDQRYIYPRGPSLARSGELDDHWENTRSPVRPVQQHYLSRPQHYHYGHQGYQTAGDPIRDAQAEAEAAIREVTPLDLSPNRESDSQHSDSIILTKPFPTPPDQEVPTPLDLRRKVRFQSPFNSTPKGEDLLPIFKDEKLERQPRVHLTRLRKASVDEAAKATPAEVIQVESGSDERAPPLKRTRLTKVDVASGVKHPKVQEKEVQPKATKEQDLQSDGDDEDYIQLHGDPNDFETEAVSDHSEFDDEHLAAQVDGNNEWDQPADHQFYLAENAWKESYWRNEANLIPRENIAIGIKYPKTPWQMPNQVITPKGTKYSCAVPGCPIVCADRWNYKVHFRAQHLGIQAFVCRACNARFSYRTQLIKHLDKSHDLNPKVSFWKRVKALTCTRHETYLDNPDPEVFPSLQQKRDSHGRFC